MIVIGIVLLIVAFLAKITILWTIGIILIVIGAVLFLLVRLGTRSADDGITGKSGRTRCTRTASVGA
ncbi:cell division protein FtsW (lipid II flippase) [Streptomyces atratus]